MRLILLALGLTACGGHGLTRHEPSSPPYEIGFRCCKEPER